MLGQVYVVQLNFGAESTTKVNPIVITIASSHITCAASITMIFKIEPFSNDCTGQLNIYKLQKHMSTYFFL